MLNGSLNILHKFVKPFYDEYEDFKLATIT